ncbi:hypothetical protein B0H13DRAFT_1905579 [Mycena leptocephala]|nr:hypothetical protein B0H13DRAFT_1905579 [Mycena leptocephala]
MSQKNRHQGCQNDFEKECALSDIMVRVVSGQVLPSRNKYILCDPYNNMNILTGAWLASRYFPVIYPVAPNIFSVTRARRMARESLFFRDLPSRTKYIQCDPRKNMNILTGAWLASHYFPVIYPVAPNIFSVTRTRDVNEAIFFKNTRRAFASLRRYIQSMRDLPLSLAADAGYGCLENTKGQRNNRPRRLDGHEKVSDSQTMRHARQQRELGLASKASICESHQYSPGKKMGDIAPLVHAVYRTKSKIVSTLLTFFGDAFELRDRGRNSSNTPEPSYDAVGVHGAEFHVTWARKLNLATCWSEPGGKRDERCNLIQWEMMGEGKKDAKESVPFERKLSG